MNYLSFIYFTFPNFPSERKDANSLLQGLDHVTIPYVTVQLNRAKPDSLNEILHPRMQVSGHLRSPPVTQFFQGEADISEFYRDLSSEQYWSVKILSREIER